jgi:hypothetical protein
MFEYRLSVFASLITLISLGTTAQATPVTTAQPAPELHAQVRSHIPSFGDNYTPTDRPAGFGTLNSNPPSFNRPAINATTDRDCLRDFAHDSRCHAPAAVTNRKSSPPAANTPTISKNRQPSVSPNNPYRVRWNKNSKF